MMIIIADKSPDKAVDWLVENTNKNFCFKQLLELGQLICSCGISNIFKPIRQGKVIQEWIEKDENIFFVFRYYGFLRSWCEDNIKCLPSTFLKILTIEQHFWQYIYRKRYTEKPIKTAIWRYSKEYESEYPTNSELPIEVVTELYKKYITEFKFKKSEV